MSRFLLARVLRATAGRLLPLLFRTRVLGAENVRPGGAVLAGNHVSYMDPVLLWCVAPRPVHFMAKRELWDNRFLAWAIEHLWGFPVTRGEPDRAAIAKATELVRSGELVGVFPEGTRSESGGESRSAAHGGAAFIALRGDAPIVPVAFLGTEKVWPRGQRWPKLRRVTVSFGVPIAPSEADPSLGRKERVDALTGILMKRISEELESARRR